MFRTHTCGELSAANQGQKVTLAGWVQHLRDLGQMVFIDLRDRYGITQLAFNEKSAPGLLEAAKKLGREYVYKPKVRSSNAPRKIRATPPAKWN